MRKHIFPPSLILQGSEVIKKFKTLTLPSPRGRGEKHIFLSFFHQKL
jgi:hypothetical protein